MFGGRREGREKEKEGGTMESRTGGREALLRGKWMAHHLCLGANMCEMHFCNTVLQVNQIN